MNNKLIEFAKEQSVVFPEDSAMGWYLRETMKMLQEEPCCNCIEFKRYAKKMGFEIEQNSCEELDFVQPHKKVSVNLEPCEDAISREELNSKTYKMPNGMELIFEYDNKHLGNISLECMDMLMGIIEDSSHGKRK